MKGLNALFVLFATAFVWILSLATPQDDPKLTEVWEPVPPRVAATRFEAPPSDALTLITGEDLGAWHHTDRRTPEWELEDGLLTVAPGTGDLMTKRGFGDVQLHIEWRTPEEVVGSGQDAGNSGVFLMSRYEIQVLDSYENTTYANGQAGAIYKQHIPRVNASKPAGEWQSFDVVFSAPRFGSDGAVEQPAIMTVFHNGVLIHDRVVLRGTTTYIGQPAYEHHGEREPLLLQDHGNRVSFRNLWIRELNESANLH